MTEGNTHTHTHLHTKTLVCGIALCLICKTDMLYNTPVADNVNHFAVVVDHICGNEFIRGRLSEAMTFPDGFGTS